MVFVPDLTCSLGSGLVLGKWGLGPLSRNAASCEGDPQRADGGTTGAEFCSPASEPCGEKSCIWCFQYFIAHFGAGFRAHAHEPAGDRELWPALVRDMLNAVHNI